MASSIITVAAAEDPRGFRVSEALAAHDRGWLLVPVDGKIPVQTGWSNAEPASREQVKSWAEQFNVAVRTGAPSGVIVIDDDNHGELAAEKLQLPDTVTVLTGGGGHHYYFAAPDQKIPNSASSLLPGVDVRGDGGLAVLPGGIHPETSNCYLWAPGRSPQEIDLADLPSSILEKLRQSPKPEPSCKSNPKLRLVNPADRYAAAALESACSAVRSAEEGCRNDTLNRESFGIGQLVGAGRLGETEASEQLGAAARACGLPDRESAPTIASGLRAGIENPRHRDEHPDPSESDDLGRAPALREVATKEQPRKSVLVLPGELHIAVDETMAALQPSRDYGIFQRGTQLARIVRTATPSSANGVRRDGGSLLIYPVTAPYLTDRLTRAIAWKRRKDDELLPTDCPSKVVKSLLARVGEWDFDSLVGILEAPTLREDGSILRENGYDEQSRLFLDLNGLVVPAIPEEPTFDQGRAALEKLLAIVVKFPFVEPCDRAAAIAAILTALVRKSLRTAPMFAFRAPKMASGKSLLADVVSLIAVGRVAAAMSQGRDDEEIRKRIFALLLEGESVGCIDNVERPLGGDSLCSVLSQEVIKDRLLGKSENIPVSTRSTWLATGNNMTIVGDLTTRVIPCDLDPKTERPEERKFDVNLYSYIPRHRGELIAAGLTALRAFIVKGSPSQGLPVFGRFEQWSDLIRNCLVWLDLADPHEGRKRLEVTDPVRSQIIGILSQWWKEFGGSEVTVAEVIKRASSGDEGEPSALHEALLEVASVGGQRLNSRKLGAWLSKHVARREGGYHVERLGDRSGVKLWRVNRDE